jgi:hypothetical protein
MTLYHEGGMKNSAFFYKIYLSMQNACIGGFYLCLSDIKNMFNFKWEGL